MNMINSTAASYLATNSGEIAASPLNSATSEKATAFNKLLYAGMPQGDVGALSPQQMLVRQAETLSTTVGVDLGAKIAGAVSQSVNKLANMA